MSNYSVNELTHVCPSFFTKSFMQNDVFLTFGFSWWVRLILIGVWFMMHDWIGFTQHWVCWFMYNTGECLFFLIFHALLMLRMHAYANDECLGNVDAECGCVYCMNDFLRKLDLTGLQSQLIIFVCMQGVHAAEIPLVYSLSPACRSCEPHIG